MSQVEISKRFPNKELRQAINGAVRYARSMRESVVDEVHLFRDLLATPSVRALDLSPTVPELTRNSIDLAYRVVFGKGTENNQQDPPFSHGLTEKIETVLDQAGEVGREAGPLDMLDLITKAPSLATEIVIEKALEGRGVVPDEKNTDVVEPTLERIREFTLKSTTEGVKISTLYKLKRGVGPLCFIPAGLSRVIVD